MQIDSYNVYAQRGTLKLLGKITVNKGQTPMNVARARYNVEHPVLAPLDARGNELVFPSIDSVFNDPV